MVESELGAELRLIDLDRCVHCGLCLNACPTYRELGVEMDSPRGRIYQMVQVATGAAVTPSYLEHIGLCLACRGCESACPSGVPYGRLIEGARADLARRQTGGWLARKLRRALLVGLLESRWLLGAAGLLFYAYEACGLKALARSLANLKFLGRLGDLAHLAPSAEPPFFFAQIGRTFPPQGARRRRIAFLSGCVANVSFARLNDATVRVLQRNGCEVVVPAGQGCCGALPAHAGLVDDARRFARRNIDAVSGGGFDAILSNAAGCGAAFKEYGALLADDPQYAERAREFGALALDITEFLASLELNTAMGPVDAVATYQDSCHLAHAQGVRSAPRKLLKQVPGLSLREMRAADVCCGGAGSYSITQNRMSMRILASKMKTVNATGARIVATANPGCMIQLQAGVRLHGSGQRVMHVIEVLDLAYRNHDR